MTGQAFCETAHIVGVGPLACAAVASQGQVSATQRCICFHGNQKRNALGLLNGGGVAEKAEIPYTVAIPAIQTVARPIAVLKP